MPATAPSAHVRQLLDECHGQLEAGDERTLPLRRDELVGVTRDLLAPRMVFAVEDWLVSVGRDGVVAFIWTLRVDHERTSGVSADSMSVSERNDPAELQLSPALELLAGIAAVRAEEADDVLPSDIEIDDLGAEYQLTMFPAGDDLAEALVAAEALRDTLLAAAGLTPAP